MAELWQEAPFDLIHAHFTYPDGVVAARLAEQFGVPFVVTEHAPWRPWMDEYPRVRRQAVQAASRAAWVLAVSESVRQGKPMVEAAMFDLQTQLTTFVPGKTGCLACLYPETPPAWKRQFPVLGAVSGSVGAMAATEAIKVVTGVGAP